ncbi:PP2C family protein-serine/threonine phosphatase [Haliangium ochraceum]|uniref:Protein serine/threonine phosphatase n=1 Tax=Haliangium ochraceum (strain DSM 14365 / JCM 11303 / SMP-2) TaxID=502025 RepID=D0LLT0_HALO1|nr:PP2C family protein-serine/threonine phosphatase [Haliangium ochraceum]ACY15108.1 protein serine/threonine phosphatase [Haliangium ochraceum DSM 14365]
MSRTRSDAVALPWRSSLLLLAPAVLLLAAAAWFGPDTGAGFGLLSAAGSYLILDLAILQPRLAYAAHTRCALLAQRVAWYHDQLRIAAQPSEIIELLAQVARELGASGRSILVLRDGNTPSVHTAAGAPVGDIDAELVEWISAQTGLMDLGRPDKLDQSDDAGAQSRTATARLFAQTACRLAMPLRWGKRALGVAFVDVGRSAQKARSARQAYEWLGIMTSLDLQRRRLGDNIHEGTQLRSLVSFARAAQEALMPDEQVHRSQGFLIQGLFRPAAACGGDLWLWRSLGHGRVLIVVGDVTDHGVAPAMLSAAAIGTIQSFAIDAGAELAPELLLRELSRSLFRLARRKYMMTGFAAVLDREAGEIRYTNAGQNFPYLLHRSRGHDGEIHTEVRPLLGTGPLIGLAPDTEFPCERAPLAAGDTVVLYTDGLIEAGPLGGKMYGNRRLFARLSDIGGGPTSELAAGLFDDIQRYSGDADPGDDMSVVVAAWPPEGAED